MDEKMEISKMEIPTFFSCGPLAAVHPTVMINESGHYARITPKTVQRYNAIRITQETLPRNLWRQPWIEALYHQEQCNHNKPYN